MWPIILVFSASVCYGQNVPTESLHSGLTERIGNFSIELLYHTSKARQPGLNLVLSPITVWTALAVMAEGATRDTAFQIYNALRITRKQTNITRTGFQSIYKWLDINSSTVELENINSVFIDEKRLLQMDFKTLVEPIYKTKVIPIDFSAGETTENAINQAVSTLSRGKISKLLNKRDFEESQMILASAVYFKGQWAIPFNATQTARMPFYDNAGQKIGDVNMMYNRYRYPFSIISKLQARVVELPYAKDSRLSMLVMLPNPGVSLEDMFLNFAKVPIDTIFSELRIAEEDYGEDEVDCYIPRFRIQSDLDLIAILQRLGVYDLFEEKLARLPLMARFPVYVSKFIHKAEIEVAEEASKTPPTKFSSNIPFIYVVEFKADRPFCYLIIEKVTNSIVFGGLYQEPSVY